VAARHLVRAGIPVHVVLTAPPGAARGDAALNLTALQRMGGVAIADGSGWTGEAPWRNWFAGAAVVVDAIFGTGFRGAMEGVPAAGGRRDERRHRPQDSRSTSRRASTRTPGGPTASCSAPT
jgi:NAD(P)H-hydrate epimerase